MNESLVLCFPEYREPARRMASAAGYPAADVHIHHFPDGESRVQLPVELPPTVFFCRSLNQPNDKLIELVLAAATARRLGAKRLILVAPYLCYMRQDKAFHPGEAISQRIIGELLAERFDGLITVDPHLHRIRHLQQAVPVEQAVALTATGPMSAWLAETVEDPLLLGPDEESVQWVAAIAHHNRLDYCVARKERLGDRSVRITLPRNGFDGRHIVLVDDVASTGRTLETAARELLSRHRPASISVLVTHALFLGHALERLRNAGIGRIGSCDTIPHPTNVIELAPLLAKAIRARVPATSGREEGSAS